MIGRHNHNSAQQTNKQNKTQNAALPRNTIIISSRQQQQQQQQQRRIEEESKNKESNSIYDQE